MVHPVAKSIGMTLVYLTDCNVYLEAVIDFLFLRLRLIDDSNSKDIIEEYHILLNELKEYNPELLDKDRLIAISKADMLDDELTEAIRQEVAAGLGDTPFLFISSVAGKGIQQLKDKLWEMIQ